MILLRCSRGSSCSLFSVMFAYFSLVACLLLLWKTKSQGSSDSKPGLETSKNNGVNALDIQKISKNAQELYQACKSELIAFHKDIIYVKQSKNLLFEELQIMNAKHKITKTEKEACEKKLITKDSEQLEKEISQLKDELNKSKARTQRMGALIEQMRSQYQKDFTKNNISKNIENLPRLQGSVMDIQSVDPDEFPEQDLSLMNINKADVLNGLSVGRSINSLKEDDPRLMTNETVDGEKQPENEMDDAAKQADLKIPQQNLNRGHEVDKKDHNEDLKANITQMGTDKIKLEDHGEASVPIESISKKTEKKSDFKATNDQIRQGTPLQSKNTLKKLQLNLLKTKEQTVIDSKSGGKRTIVNRTEANTEAMPVASPFVDNNQDL